MNELYDNAFNFKTGLIEGDHLRHLSKIGIHKLIERCDSAIMGCDRRLTADDLPGKVRALVEQGARLAEQLAKCDAIDLGTARTYLAAQAKLAGEALPIIGDVLQRQEAAAKDAIAELRKTLTGKGGAIAGAAAAMLLHNADVTGAAEREAGLCWWRCAFAICRDTAANAKPPRWLTCLIAAHEAHKLGTAAG